MPQTRNLFVALALSAALVLGLALLLFLSPTHPSASDKTRGATKVEHRPPAASGMVPESNPPIAQVVSEQQPSEEHTAISGGETLFGRVEDADGMGLAGAVVGTVGRYGVRTSTDAEGRFELPGLGAPEVVVRVEKPEYLTKSLLLPVPSEAVVITLARPATISGTVVLKPTGEPVSGAEVRLFVAALGEERAITAPRTTTNEKGEFVFNDVSEDTYHLVVAHADYPRKRIPDLAVAAGETHELPVIALNSGGGIQGTVTRAGVPAAQMTVVAYRNDGQEKSSREATTDEAGRFEIVGLNAGEYTIGVRAAGPGDRRLQLLVTVFEDQMSEVAITLGALARLHGTVTQSGTPVNRGSIRVFSSGASQAVAWTRINPRGIYDVKLPGSGEYSLVVTPSSGGMTHVRVVVPEGTTEVRQDVELPQGQIAGTVVDAETGLPVAGAAAMVVSAGAPFSSLASLHQEVRGSSSTDDAGQFLISNLWDGTYDLRVSAKAYAQTVLQVVVADSRGVEVQVVLERGMAFQARVVDASGRPIQGAVAVLRDASGQLVAPTRPLHSNRDGLLAISAVSPGLYRLTVAHQAYASSQLVADLTGGEITQPTVELQPGGQLHVLVVGGQSVPVEGARVELLDDRGINVLEDVAVLLRTPQRTDFNGEVVLDHVPPGNFRLLATLDHLQTAPETLTVDNDRASEVRLSFR